MDEKEGKVDVDKWLKYLYAKSKDNDKELKEINNDLQEIKKKLEILGETVLKLYEEKRG